MKAEREKRRLGWGRIAVCALLLLLAVTLALFFRHVTGMLPSQQAAERWAGDVGRFAQITVFLPEHDGLSQPAVQGLQAAIWGALNAEGLEPDTPAGAPVFAYSAEGVLRVTSRYRNPVDVYVTGVGGNFFLFHPVQLISGAMLPAESLNRDLVLIDETLAWWLFGATDVAGMELIIDGAPYLISGVYRPLQNFASRAAYGEMPHLFLYYEALAALSLGGTPITTVEAVLPNPISGIAEEIVTDALEAANVEEGRFVLVDNTSRYTLFSLLDVIRDFGQRSMYRTGLRLPHWENAARMAEDFAALSLVLILIVLVYPANLAVRVCARRWRQRKWRIKLARKKLDDLREQRRETEWQNTHQFHVDEIIRSVRESEEDHEKED